MDFIIHYAVEICFGLAMSLIGFLYKQAGKYIKIIQNDEKTIKEIVKFIIVEKYHEVEVRKKITLSEKEMMNNLYSKYECLGCDPFTEDLMEKINNIPTEDS